MKNLSIKFKLWSNLALFLTFFIAMWLLSYSSSAKISTYLDSDKVELMRLADSLRQSLKSVEDLINDAAQTQELDFLEEADVKKDEFLETIEKLKAIDEENLAEYDLAGSEFSIYYNAAHRAATLVINQDTFTEELAKHAETVRKTLPALRKDVDGILARSYDTFSLVLDQSTHVATLLVTQNFVLLVTIIMLSVIVFPMIIHSIIKPIEKLSYATEELGKGNLDTQAEVVSLDEIGSLAMSFNKMTRSLKEKSEALEKTTDELQSSLDIRGQMQQKIVDANRELKDANKRLLLADHHKSEFLASMSHELRTPLNAIINFTDQILEDWTILTSESEESDEARDMLTRVLKNSRHLLSLINDLLDLAKIESGFMSLDIRETDIREVVEDAIASVSSLAKAKNLDISVVCVNDLAHFLIDERRILQSIINLLSNAIKFTQEGKIDVSIEMTTQEVDGGIIKVKDSGSGIPEEFINIVFDRFRQGDSGDSRKHAGTGLGLNLVREFVELHGGSVTAENLPEGGAVFTIFLPLRPVEVASEKA